MKRYFVLAVVALGLVFTACDEEENLNSSVWIGSESESNHLYGSGVNRKVM